MPLGLSPWGDIDDDAGRPDEKAEAARKELDASAGGVLCRPLVCDSRLDPTRQRHSRLDTAG